MFLLLFSFGISESAEPICFAVLPVHPESSQMALCIASVVRPWELQPQRPFYYLFDVMIFYQFPPLLPRDEPQELPQIVNCDDLKWY
jgi:hypothetical protein